MLSLLIFALLISAPPLAATAQQTPSAPSATASAAPFTVMPSQNWREILRQEAQSPTATQLARAEALFMAETRPALIRAGFGSTQEFLESYHDLSGQGKAFPDHSGKIAGALWSFYPFPALQEGLYAGLLETELSTKLRLNRFGGTIQDLLNCLSSLEKEQESAHNSLNDLKRTLRYWQNGPQRTGKQSGSQPGGPNAEADQALTALFQEKKAFAEQYLPYLLSAYAEDAPSAHLAAMEKRGLPALLPWGEARYEHNAGPYWSVESNTGDWAPYYPALLSMWKNRAQADFMATARAALQNQSLIPQQRWRIITLAARRPGRGLEEYQAILPALRGIASMNTCWRSMSATHRYGLSFGGCEGPVFEKELAELEKAPRLILGEAQGTGVSLTNLDSVPDLSAFPKLYLLFESDNAAPNKLRLNDANSRPVLSWGAFYYLDAGPRLYPLNPHQEEDEALLGWFWAQGAFGGRCTLLASAASPETLAASLERWYLTIWDSEKRGPRPILTFANGGNFQSFLLPRLKGEAAALLFGRIDRLWAGKIERDGDRLLEARPEGDLSVPQAWAARPKRPILVLSTGSGAALNAAYAEEKLLRQVISWRKKYPENGFSRAEGAAFLEELDAELARLYPDLQDEDWQHGRIRELLWRTRGGERDAALRATLLEAGSKEDASKRLRRAEKILEQAEKNKAGEGENA